jgi:hypothetical protein
VAEVGGAFDIKQFRYHPAKIRADFRLSLPQPRDRKSAEFLVYVDYIHKVVGPFLPRLSSGGRNMACWRKLP